MVTTGGAAIALSTLVGGVWLAVRLLEPASRALMEAPATASLKAVPPAAPPAKLQAPPAAAPSREVGGVQRRIEEAARGAYSQRLKIVPAPEIAKDGPSRMAADALGKQRNEKPTAAGPPPQYRAEKRPLRRLGRSMNYLAKPPPPPPVAKSEPSEEAAPKRSPQLYYFADKPALSSRPKERSAAAAEMALGSLAEKVQPQLAPPATRAPAAIAAAEAPAPVPPAEAAPVYNVEIPDKLAGEALALPAEKKVRVRFFIGPRAAASELPAVAVDEERLRRLAPEERSLALNVTLDCLLCAEDTYFHRRIRYDFAARRSEVAEFTIVPSPAAVGGAGALGELIVTVDADGIDLAVIKLAAYVGRPAVADAARRLPAPVVFTLPEEGDLLTPDVVIDIAAEGHGWLPVAVHPISPELTTALAARIGAERIGRPLRSGLGKADFNGLVEDLYKRLRTVVEQNRPALRAAADSLGEETALSPGAASLAFSPADRQQVLEILRIGGARLYFRLFRRGEPALAAAMETVAGFAATLGRPLRVRMRATNVYAPWQLMYSRTGAPAAADGFWGFRYHLGTLQKVDSATIPPRSVLPIVRASDVVFASWRGSDAVGERAARLRAHLEQRFAGTITPATSRDALLGALRERRETLALLVFYGHATSGTTLMPDAVGGDAGLLSAPAVGFDWTGERLLFAEGDALVPSQIDDLLLTAGSGRGDNPVLLEEHPIIILDACETATAGARPTNNNGFIGVLTRAGASAVIATEAPVWQNFAYWFGIELVDRIVAGESMQEAVFNVRRRHLEKRNNPLGLAYTLYGNPALRVVVASEPTAAPAP